MKYLLCVIPFLAFSSLVFAEDALNSDANSFVATNPHDNQDQLKTHISNTENILHEFHQNMDVINTELQEIKNNLYHKELLSQRSLENFDSTVIEKNIDKMKSEVDLLANKLSERKSIKGFNDYDINLGGYLHFNLAHVIAPDNSATSFNRNVFNVFMQSTPHKDWTIFFSNRFAFESELSFLDSEQRRRPDFSLSSDSTLENAWANYKVFDFFQTKLGRFQSPVGIINQDYFEPILLDPEKPQFLKKSTSYVIFPTIVNGVVLHGNYIFTNDYYNKIAYNIYAGNHNDNATNANYGGRIAYANNYLGLTLGLNVGGGKRIKGENSHYLYYGGDLNIDYGPLAWKTEIYRTNERQNGKRNRFTWYTEPSWRFGKHFIVFYRHDFLDPGSIDSDSRENAGGLVFEPFDNIKLRLTYTNKKFDSSASKSSVVNNIFQFSTTINI